MRSVPVVALLVSFAGVACDGSVPSSEGRAVQTSSSTGTENECAEVHEQDQQGGSAGFQLQGFQLQGFQLQGFQLQGTSTDGLNVLGFRYDGVTLAGGIKPDYVAVVQGNFFATSNSGISSGTTNACATPTSDGTRDCGWTVLATGTCHPKTPVSVFGERTNAACVGQPLLRVCDGKNACTYVDSVSASTKDPCGASCAYERFTWPADGTFTVLGAPTNSGDAFAISLEAWKATLQRFEFGPLDFIGASLIADSYKQADGTAGPQITFRITATQPEDPSFAPVGTTSLYSLQLFDPAGNTWVQGCGVDPYGNSYAIPFTSVWDRFGARLDDSAHFTLGCTNGVIAKCNRWGYRPWIAPTDPTNPNQFVDMHQACTRMARADYCGDGVSHTMTNTCINEWDDSGLASGGEISSTDLMFEAGWSTKGATCLSHYRWENLPIVPPETLCPLPGHTAPYCQGPNCTGGDIMPAICDTPDEAHTLGQVRHLTVDVYDQSIVHDQMTGTSCF